MPPRPSRIPLLLATLLLAFTTLLITGLRNNIASQAEALVAHLQAHQP